MKINSQQFACYLHIPFCQEKCDYCDYYSLTDYEEYLTEYISSLQREIELRADKLDYQGEAATIYLGGGTPSLLPPDHMEKLLQTIKLNFSFSAPFPEITLEINPGDLQNESRLKSWQNIGINRFSLGVQSLNPGELEVLNRMHDEKQAINALEILHNQEVNYNIDLIYGSPRQTPASFFDSLKRVLQFSPAHISVYSLELKAGTPLKAKVETGKLQKMSEEEQVQIFSRLPKILRRSGFKNYEIANYAMPGYKCKHNLYYWKSLDYLGFGPGAQGLWRGKRRKNYCDLYQYLDCLNSDELPPGEVQELTMEEKISEFMIMGLRLKNGVSIKEFNSRFPASIFSYFTDEIKSLKNESLLRQKKDRIFLTQKGRQLGNYVFKHFII